MNQVEQSKSKHRRTKSDGNNPAQFKFNQVPGKNTLGKFTAPRLQETTNKKAELSSSETGETHHQPNAQEVNNVSIDDTKNGKKTVPNIVAGQPEYKKRVKSTSQRRAQNTKSLEAQVLPSSSIEPENEGELQVPKDN